MIRLWRAIIDKLGLPHVNTFEWQLHDSVKQWWDIQTDNRTSNWHAMASLTMLVGWTIWKERNARVFQHKSTPTLVIFSIIKKEARLWVIAAVKQLRNIMRGE